jgi:TonB-linked SusC/RagA family outer membrane protein
VFVGVNFLQAQTVQITGAVSSAEEGPLPGVSIVVKGTTVGTTTDGAGKYSLNVPANATTLTFSFMGYKAQDVAIEGRRVIDVILISDAVALQEIVVTALGITREKKALGYAIQEVKGDDLNKAGQTNVLNTLSGKFAGVQITGASGNTGGSAKILIRGVASMTGNNDPLFVVDGTPIDNSNYNTANANVGAGGYDYGNMAQDINPEDIESITVLKGASASALYGTRALNGVILITTKKGSKSKGLGVTFNSGVSFENAAYFPKHQKLYGGGDTYSGAGTLDGFLTDVINGTTYRLVDWGMDETWGPKYDASITVLPWNAFDAWDTENYLVPKPWVYPKNDFESFFETGVTLTNSVSINGSNELGDFRLSYTNMDVDGYMPGSSMQRNSVSFNGSSKLTKYLEGFTSFNYVKTASKGRPETGYGDKNPIMRMHQWGQNQLDYVEMKAYKNPDGTQRTWNRTWWDDPTPVYSDNPYWSSYENAPEDLRNRFFGNLGFTASLTSWLKARAKINLDYFAFRIEDRTAIGSQALPFYDLQNRLSSEINSEFMLLVDKRITDDITFNALFGANRMDQLYQLTGGSTNGGLLLRNWYHLSNSADPAVPYNNNRKKRINSLYGSATIGFMNMLYLDASFRGDWSSTLPADANFYSYPSVTTSFIFTELPMLKDNPYLSFGKIRLNFAQVGGDAGAYQLMDVYQANQNFGSYPNYQLPTALNNPALKPEKTSSYEAGIDLKFFNNRLGIDFTYYDNTTINQIVPVPTSAATGYFTQFINAGELTNKGIELMLTGTPVKLNNGFQWDVVVNFAKNENKVVELAPGVTTYRLGGLFGTEVHASAGEKYGSIKGFNFMMDEQGNRLIDATGRYRQKAAIETVGSYLPDFNAGLINTFTYKGIDLSVQIDMQQGGQMFSLTNMWATYSGIIEETAALNGRGVNIREPVSANGGILLPGVYGNINSAGEVVYTTATGAASTVPVTNETYIAGTRWAWDHYSRARAAQNTFSTDYFKLREVRIGYRIPQKYTSVFRNVKVSAYGRNLAIWGQENKHFDPEYVHGSGNVQGIEGGALPSLRTYGFNLSFDF